jgi:hypothetical protein
MGVTGKSEFSFGELLVLIDVEGGGAMSTPLPTWGEAAGVADNALRGIAPGVEVHGRAGFTPGSHICTCHRAPSSS